MSRLASRTLPLAAILLALGLLAISAVTLLLMKPGGGDPGVGGPFKLESTAGGTVTERDLVGAPTLVFFGFTHCPDVCPATLMAVSEVLRAAGPAGAPLKALFVTVDPARDTREVLASYIGSFDPRIQGLTGSEAEIERMVKAYKAYARKVPLKDGDYTMDHSTLVYLMDRRGRFVGSFDLDRTPEAAAKAWLSHL